MTDRTTAIGPILGKIPSGLAIATSGAPGRRTAFLASWFQQLSFEPPLVGVCVKAGRPILPLVEDSGWFALNLLAEGDKESLKRYGRGFDPGVDPWAEDPEGLLPGLEAPVLRRCLGYLLMRHVRTLETSGDHLILVGEVRDGAVLETEAKPFVHIRRDGFGY